MTLAKLKATPFGVHDRLTSVEIEILNEEIPFAIDGRHGGTYSLDAPLTINGPGFDPITFNADFVVAGSMTVSGASNFTGEADFNGGAAFMGTSQIYSVLSTNAFQILSGAAFTVQLGGLLTCYAPAFLNGATTFAGTVAMNATVTLGAAAPLVLGNSLTVAANLTMNGSQATFSASTAVTINGAIIMSGIGHIVQRVYSVATPPGSFLDSNTSISPATSGAGIVTADMFQPGTLAANRTWTVLGSGASDGSTVEVSLIDCPPGFIVTLVRDDATVIVSLINAGGLYYAAKLVRKAGAWQIHTVTRK